MREIAEALAFAHARGIIHRDVKPENVVLTAAGSAKRVDFGIAQALAPDARVQITQGIVGTPRYMAPEQLLAGPLDGRADQFTWALVAYELWTGSPFPRGLDGQAIEAHVALERLPAGFADVLTRALSAQREQRFGSMAEIVARLDERAFEDRKGTRAVASDARSSDEARSGGIDKNRKVRTMAGIVASLRHADTERPPAVAWARFAVLGAAVVLATLHFGYGVLGTRAAKPEPHADPVVATVGSSSPAVHALLEGALQLWKDGAGGPARNAMARAAALEPGDPRPHVWIAAASDPFDETARDHATQAISLRARLGDVDAALLDALRPLLDEPPDVATSTARFETLSARYPDEPVVRLAQARHFLRIHEPRRALAVGEYLKERGTAALWIPARAYLELGNLEDGRRMLEQCIQASPGATDCLEWLGRVDTNDGRCATSETTARKFIAQSPDDPLGYMLLVRAVAGQTHSTQAARVVFRSRLEHVPPASRLSLEASTETMLHVFDGDFDAASRYLDQWQRSLPSSNPSSLDRALAILWRMELALELGQEAQAREAAREFEYASRAWTQHDFMDAPLEAARALYLTSQISRDTLLQARNEAAAREAQRGGYYATAGARWFDLYVQTAVTDDDVRDAMSTEPKERPLFDPVWHEVGFDAEVGHVYLRAGRLDDAAVSLDRATRSCCFLTKPHEYVRAFLWLGEVRDLQGNHGAACEAYAQVLQRWGREPRSVTAREARRRMANCPAPIPSSNLSTVFQTRETKHP
jgi:tetratricopeptide (TPR) repeat protein